MGLEKSVLAQPQRWLAQPVLVGLLETAKSDNLLAVAREGRRIWLVQILPRLAFRMQRHPQPLLRRRRVLRSLRRPLLRILR